MGRILTVYRTNQTRFVSYVFLLSLVLDLLPIPSPSLTARPLPRTWKRFSKIYFVIAATQSPSTLPPLLYLCVGRISPLAGQEAIIDDHLPPSFRLCAFAFSLSLCLPRFPLARSRTFENVASVILSLIHQLRQPMAVPFHSVNQPPALRCILQLILDRLNVIRVLYRTFRFIHSFYPSRFIIHAGADRKLNALPRTRL